MIAPLDLSGSVIDGRYTLITKLGDGGAGSVYRATDNHGARSVALKLLDPVLAKRDDMRQRFEREARALNGLDHPHMIRFHDFGFDEGVPYLVMELLSGTTLERLIAKRPLAPEVAVDLFIGVVAALAHAHVHGVLHRDLKPANIFIAVLEGGSLHPKLLDFGLARFTDRERWGGASTITEEGTVVGTPMYMAPEQGFGGRADASSDVYSAGVVLYELLALRPPFVDASRATLIRMHSLQPPPPLAEVRPELLLQPALHDVLDRALAKKGRERYADARELLQALQAVPEPAATLR